MWASCLDNMINTSNKGPTSGPIYVHCLSFSKLTKVTNLLLKFFVPSVHPNVSYHYTIVDLVA